MFDFLKKERAKETKVLNKLHDLFMENKFTDSEVLSFFAANLLSTFKILKLGAGLMEKEEEALKELAGVASVSYKFIGDKLTDMFGEDFKRNDE